MTNVGGGEEEEKVKMKGKSSSKRRIIQQVTVWPNIIMLCFLHDVSKVKGNIIAKHKNIHTEVTWSKLGVGETFRFKYV
jgi:hypothetical protein